MASYETPLKLKVEIEVDDLTENSKKIVDLSYLSKVKEPEPTIECSVHACGRPRLWRSKEIFNDGYCWLHLPSQDLWTKGIQKVLTSEHSLVQQSFNEAHIASSIKLNGGTPEFKDVGFDYVKDSEFVDTHFERLSFQNTVFSLSHLAGAKFDECTLSNVRFTGCNLRYASFIDCRIDGFEVNGLPEKKVRQVADGKQLLEETLENLAFKCSGKHECHLRGVASFVTLKGLLIDPDISVDGLKLTHVKLKNARLDGLDMSNIIVEGGLEFDENCSLIGVRLPARSEKVIKNHATGKNIAGLKFVEPLSYPIEIPNVNNNKKPNNPRDGHKGATAVAKEAMYDWVPIRTLKDLLNDISNVDILMPKAEYSILFMIIFFQVTGIGLAVGSLFAALRSMVSPESSFLSSYLIGTLAAIIVMAFDISRQLLKSDDTLT